MLRSEVEIDLLSLGRLFWGYTVLKNADIVGLHQGFSMSYNVKRPVPPQGNRIGRESSQKCKFIFSPFLRRKISNRII